MDLCREMDKEEERLEPIKEDKIHALHTIEEEEDTNTGFQSQNSLLHSDQP